MRRLKEPRKAPSTPGPARTSYTGYTDSRIPSTQRAGDADILVRGPNYVWNLLNTRGGRTPTAFEPKTRKAKKAKRRAPGNDTGLVLGVDPIGAISDAVEDTAQPQQSIFNRVGTYYARIAGPGARQFASVRSSAAGRTNRTGAKSTRPLATDDAASSGAPRATRTGESKVVSVPGVLQTQVLVDQATRGKPFAKVLTDPNSTWQPAATARPSSATKDPGNANPIPTGQATTGPPKWWTDYAMPLIDALKKGKAEPKERASKTAAQTRADVSALLGASPSPLTALDTGLVPSTSLAPATQTATSTKTCECPPKRQRRPSCRNPVVSRSTKGGVRTTKVRLLCQSSKRK